MNKPVAWKIKWDDREWIFSDDEDDIKMSNKHKWQSIPLYTAGQLHPVKELTDEEIEQLFLDETGFPTDCDAKIDSADIVGFAKAILRKAQEK